MTGLFRQAIAKPSLEALGICGGLRCAGAILLAMALTAMRLWFAGIHGAAIGSWWLPEMPSRTGRG